MHFTPLFRANSASRRGDGMGEEGGDQRAGERGRRSPG